MESPVYTEASLRWLIFNARSNGLERVLVRSGRRVFINIRKFEQWLENEDGDAAADSSAAGAA